MIRLDGQFHSIELRDADIVGYFIVICIERQKYLKQYQRYLLNFFQPGLTNMLLRNLI